ncbi:MAG: cytochrome b/b6 domain-containing protein [Phaeospirillum sp.]|nr:cytochrome b/b6 domain-containing protein [Phaeospirillum sp.]
MKYDPLTRILHLLVAVGVTSQMVTSLVMIHPKPGRLPNEWYGVHELIGIGLLGVTSLYWLWVVGRGVMRGEALMLFPWFSRGRLSELRADIAETVGEGVRGRLPDGSQTRPLPAAVQGGGLLIALFMAATGTALAVGAAPNGGLSPSLRTVKEVHEAMAPLMWAYLIVHPLLGLLHQLAGHRTLNRMFGLR